MEKYLILISQRELKGPSLVLCIFTLTKNVWEIVTQKIFTALLKVLIIQESQLMTKSKTK